MIDAKIIEQPNSRWLHLIEEVDETGEPTAGHHIDLAAIPEIREMLGIDDLQEVLDAVLHLLKHGEPPHDPVTGQNVWTEPYMLLTIRERAREDAARRARLKRLPEAEVREAANTAAYHAVHTPIDGGDCAMDRCRKEARRKLGIPDPKQAAGVRTRVDRPLPPKTSNPDPGKAKALSLLAEETAYLHGRTQRWLHGLVDDGRPDPVHPPAPESPAPELPTPRETIKKYQA
jgi:hypothetical protein